VLGYGFALASATAWSSYTVLLRKWGGGRGFLLPASILSAALSFVWLLSAGWPDGPGSAAWLGIFDLGAIAIGVAILAWERAVSGGQVALLGALSYLAPFLSAFFLWLILGKPIGGFTAARMVSIVADGVGAARWRHQG
jgi:drug/metabolite transporter (DMT)-like permease